jgi:hypothetical protein
VKYLRKFELIVAEVMSKDLDMMGFGINLGQAFKSGKILRIK